MERERMSLKAVTIAQVLKSAGYTTGIFGKWHLGDEAPYQPGRRGFDEVSHLVCKALLVRVEQIRAETVHDQARLGLYPRCRRNR